MGYLFSVINYLTDVGLVHSSENVQIENLYIRTFLVKRFFYLHTNNVSTCNQVSNENRRLDVIFMAVSRSSNKNVAAD